MRKAPVFPEPLFHISLESMDAQVMLTSLSNANQVFS